MQQARPLRNYQGVVRELDPARKNPPSQKRMTMPWIRPQDQMPEFDEPVLITDIEGLQIVAWRDRYTGKWHSENHSWFTHEVLCYMPIPEIV